MHNVFERHRKKCVCCDKSTNGIPFTMDCKIDSFAQVSPGYALYFRSILMAIFLIGSIFLVPMLSRAVFNYQGERCEIEGADQKKEEEKKMAVFLN
jgi:hypothetical protein